MAAQSIHLGLDNAPPHGTCSEYRIRINFIYATNDYRVQYNSSWIKVRQRALQPLLQFVGKEAILEMILGWPNVTIGKLALMHKYMT